MVFYFWSRLKETVVPIFRHPFETLPSIWSRFPFRIQGHHEVDLYLHTHTYLTITGTYTSRVFKGSSQCHCRQCTLNRSSGTSKIFENPSGLHPGVKCVTIGSVEWVSVYPHLWSLSRTVGSREGDYHPMIVYDKRLW